MPKVRTVQQSVLPTQVTDQRLSVNVSPGQFGSDIATGLQSVGTNLAKMQAEDDAAAATDAFNRASEEARLHLYEGDDAVYSRQGKNATGSHDTSKSFFEETHNRYSGELQNDNQRKAFKSLWDKRTTTNLDNVARHEAGQRKVYFEQNQKANLVSNVNHAANNFDKPDEIQSALTNADTIILSNPGGNSAAVIDQKRAEARSSIHKSVVDRMMIDNPDGAREYYNANKDSIDGQHHKQIESALKGNKQKKQAQVAADEIMATTKNDNEKRQDAKKIKNPEVRALTEALVNQDINRRKTDRIEIERQMNEGFWKEFIANPDINTIPDNLPADTKLKAIKFASNPASRKTDLKRWNEINQMTINDPEAFVKMDLTNDILNLDESDFQAFGKLQRTLGKDKTKLTHVQGAGIKANRALKAIGVKVDSDKGQLFMRRFQDDLSELETLEKRKAKPDEIDSIIDRLLITGETKDGSTFGFNFNDPDKRLFEVDETDTFFIEDVPDTERKKIIQAFKNRGTVPTEDQIIQLYTRKVTQK